MYWNVGIVSKASVRNDRGSIPDGTIWITDGIDFRDNVRDQSNLFHRTIQSSNADVA